MTGPAAHEVTRLLLELRNGREDAAEQLIPLVYAELRGLAVHHMRKEDPGHTLQPTALVHEAYFRLMDQQHGSWQNRAHFFGIASQAMRRILVDHVRRRRATKRDAGDRVTLDESIAAEDSRIFDLLALNDALDRLGDLEPRAARVVELRYFGGLDIDETAEALGVSPASVKRDWTFARAFLHRELRGTAADSSAPR
jgi:RNA polymerase sigma-70 factor (ECF subfamily)